MIPSRRHETRKPGSGEISPRGANHQRREEAFKVHKPLEEKPAFYITSKGVNLIAKIIYFHWKDMAGND